jgi:membrane associated rhomboid family serine protease
MAASNDEILTQVLRACATVAPQPLYPSRYVQESGLDRATLDSALDDLRRAGYVQLTDWAQGLGQGYALTSEGAAAAQRLDPLRRRPTPAVAPPTLDEPEADPEEPARVALMTPGQPIVTRALLIFNVLVFLFGMYLAGLRDIPSTEYLNGNSIGPIGVLGSLVPRLVLDGGQWWRLLTYCFLHLGVLHLVMNMYFLYSLGPMIESMWGSIRFLLLYLVAGITGGCVVLWVSRGAAVGASGALSGLLGSLAVWIILNRDHLPAHVTAGLTRMVTINLVLLFFISLMANVSWECHLGGAVGGALVSYPLHVSRFAGSWQVRVLGFLGTLVVPVVFITLAMNRTWLHG